MIIDFTEQLSKSLYAKISETILASADYFQESLISSTIAPINRMIGYPLEDFPATSRLLIYITFVFNSIPVAIFFGWIILISVIFSVSMGLGFCLCSSFL